MVDYVHATRLAADMIELVLVRNYDMCSYQAEFSVQMTSSRNLPYASKLHVARLPFSNIALQSIIGRSWHMYHQTECALRSDESTVQCEVTCNSYCELHRKVVYISEHRKSAFPAGIQTRGVLSEPTV